MIEKNFWKNKRVLITGHTGFKGSWLAIWLRMLGAEITGFSLEPEKNNDNFVLTNIKEYINHNIEDIRDFKKLNSVFMENKPEIIFHLAAQPLVLKSYLEPKQTFDVNIGGTVNILESSRICNSVRVIINVTSDKCYLDSMPLDGYIESNRLGGFDVYSSSKAASELVTDAYRNSFFNPQNFEEHNISLSSVRAGNVIGGGDWNDDRLIPDCIRSLEENREIIVRNPKYVRPWQHVLEPLRGYLILAEKMYNSPKEYGQAWNFGPGKESFVDVETIVDKLIKFWGAGSWSSPENSNKKFHEDQKLFLNPAKARKELSWKSKYSIDDSIILTMDWYKNYSKGNVLELCEKQINDYIMD